MKKRLLSAFMALCMMVTLIPNTVYAQATTTEGNLCEHHIEHTTDCGYTEGAACTHTHDDDCGYVEGTAAQPCKFIAEESEATPADAVAHEHDGECGFADAVIGADCKHQHNELCGYIKGALCTFTKEQCVICNPKDSGSIALGLSSITVTAFDKLEGAVQQRTVPVGTELTALDLPTTLEAMGYTAVADTKVVDSGTPSDTTTTPAAISIDVVKWELDPENEINEGNSTYDPEQGSYCFTPILPKGYTLAESVKLPEIWVMIGGAALLTATDYGDFSVTTESGGTAPTYTDKVLTLGGGTYTIAMVSGATSPTTDRIVVSTGVTANITLNGVSIDVSGTGNACAFELKSGSTVNLTLAEDSTNTLISGWHVAGLQASSDTNLTIDGAGSLNVTGGDNAAGIGGGNHGAGGTITINGGTVTATGIAGAGIGGGSNQGAGGTITINGGTVTANSIGGGAGIGGGYRGAGGVITIKGGTVTADATHRGAGIGGGQDGDAGTFLTGTDGNAFIVAKSISHQSNKGNWSGVIFEGDSGLIYGTPITLKTNAEVPEGKTLTIDSGKELTINSGVTLTNRGTITNSGTFTNNGILNNYGTITNPPKRRHYQQTLTGGRDLPKR